jgi:hypothetical protein
MSTALQLVGLGLVTTGALLLSIPVGLIVAGAIVIIIGLAYTSA